jgi:glutathione S-transferase
LTQTPFGRRTAGVPDHPPGLFVFFGAESSYFSAKARPAFRIKRIPFEEHLPTADAYAVMRRRTGYTFLPTVITPEDDAWQDTSDILDRLEARQPAPPLFPTTPVQRIVAYLWEIYADEFLLIPGLHYRWSFPESEAKARRDFGAASGAPERSNALADAIKQFARAVGVVPETAAVIEAHTERLLARLEAHFDTEPWLLGGQPSLADCALMGPMYAHWYLDAVPSRLLRERAPRSCHWIERMNHPNPDAFGAWLADDALAPTMRPLLEGIGRDAVPVILDTVRAVEEWADAHATPGLNPPRALGMHASTLGGVAVQRYTSPYTLWMVHRVLDQYAALAPAGRAAVDAALAGTGCEALFAHQPRHRIGKRGFDLVFA